MFILGSLESAYSGLPISVIIELFSLGITAEALRANIGSKSVISLQRGPVDQKFIVEVVAPTNHSSPQKTRLNDLSYGTKIWTDLSSILSQITRLTDRRTESSSLDRVCIACSAVKTYRFFIKIRSLSLKPCLHQTVVCQHGFGI